MNRLWTLSIHVTDVTSLSSCTFVDRNCDSTVYPKKYAHGFCFAVLCCGYTLTDFPISTRLTSLALWQSNDCPSASKATLMNMDKYFMWIHYERLHNHNKAKHNKTVCIFLGIYCMMTSCHGNAFHTTGPLWGHLQVTGGFPCRIPPTKGECGILASFWTNSRIVGDLRRHVAHETSP